MTYFKKDGNWYIIKTLYDYEIHKDRVKTPEDMRHWIIHLSQKTWANNELLTDFARGVTRDNKWDRTAAKNAYTSAMREISGVKNKLPSNFTKGETYHNLRRNRDAKELL